MIDPITRFLELIMPGVPPQVLAIIAALIVALPALAEFREEILPARRAYNNEKKRLELIKLWYEVRSLVGNEAIEAPPARLLASSTQKIRESADQTHSHARARLSFLDIPPNRQIRYFLVALGIMMLGTQVMSAVEAPLRTPDTPGDIVSLQLAGDIQIAEVIIQSWSTQARMAAALSLGLDYIYIVAYSTALILMCLIISARIRPISRLAASTGGIVIRGILVAGVMDGIENYALIRVLFGDLSAILVRIAWVCASIKFSLIAIAMLYILFSLFIILLAWGWDATRRGAGASQR